MPRLKVPVLKRIRKPSVQEIYDQIGQRVRVRYRKPGSKPEYIEGILDLPPRGVRKRVYVRMWPAGPGRIIDPEHVEYIAVLEMGVTVQCLVCGGRYFYHSGASEKTVDEQHIRSKGHIEAERREKRKCAG